MGEFVKMEREGAILTVTLDNPETLNALTSAACFELDAIWNLYRDDDSLRVAIINANGRAFCAGHDLNDDMSNPMPDTGWAGLSRRYDLDKPLIAAVHGLTLGGGWELALACDIVIADENTRFGLPEPLVGYAALGGGATRLVKRMPWHVAMGYLLTGRMMDANTAHRWGLATEVAPAGEVMAVARGYAESILRCAPQGIRTTKALALASLEPVPLQEELHAMSVRAFDHIEALEDTREGIAAFNEKRPPVWTGR